MAGDDLVGHHVAVADVVDAHNQVDLAVDLRNLTCFVELAHNLT